MMRPISAPTMRPLLPRTSSAASGLRFCGMIDEPVVKASESLTKPNCGVVHNTISSAKRERWIAAIAAAPSASSAKSRSATLSSELAVGRSKPSALAVMVAVDRKRGAGQRRRAERTFVEPLARVGEPPRVARQHLDIGQQVMAEGDRLRRLQMGESGHDHGRAVERAGRERPLQLGDLHQDRVDRVAHPEAEIDRDLVVARARGVEAPGRRADDLGKPALHVHMDVLERARERKRPRLDFAFDLRKTPRNRLGVGGFDDSLGGEHGDMGLRGRDVLGAELAVEVDRGVDLLHRFGRAPGEPAAPHRVAHALSLG